MFKAKDVVSYFRIMRDVEPGSFIGENGKEIPYNGYTRVELDIITDGSLNTKVCRLHENDSNSTEIKKILQSCNVMQQLLVDLDIELNNKNVAKLYITDLQIV